ncbi:MogA/MoaB family molybdenum cofactor biosynthesis protein [Tundrisphaera lichenicola]|uniref:MogA/MoaB family molybdenum cofactor biosynthesis protein n=1 Tax=Tundrisphaera lichenicola TaxID=2029860 RepID=UPI003EBF5CFA
MNEIVEQHRVEGPQSFRLAVLTISDTRTTETDSSGALIVELAELARHQVVERSIIPDEPDLMRPLLESYRGRTDIHAVLLTGGTGISPRDQTFETVSALLTKPLPGYGELFRMLSYAEIGTACLMSRAVGGLMGELVVLVMPGSRAAVQLAMSRIILPELPHLVHQARKR